VGSNGLVVAAGSSIVLVGGRTITVGLKGLAVAAGSSSVLVGGRG
jgi:hypothetical protein